MIGTSMDHCKRDTIFSITALFLILCTQSYLFAGETKTQVQGLFYLDQTPVTIKIADGLINRIERHQNLTDSPSDQVYIAPGFIDVQVNGYVSISFSEKNLTVEGVRKITRALWKEGVTSYLPTIISSSHEITKKNCAVLAEAIMDPEIGPCIPGIFLEGPYISPVDGFRGAHNEQWVRPPDPEEFEVYLTAAQGHVLKVGLAPEIEGNLDIIRRCMQDNIVVALAHHNGSSEEIKEAADAGATVITHLGNGCANMIHRHNNPLWPQLAEDRLSATLIVDGHHLRPEEVLTFYKAKGSDRLMLISDVTQLAGMPPGEYLWDGKKVVMTPGGMIKYPEQNVLAGAALPIHVGIGNMRRFTQCSLAEAIHMAGRNQAKLFKLHDRGVILPGKRADLVLFTLKDNQVEIQKTIVAGRLVYSRD